jgi:hypothetical protein
MQVGHPVSADTAGDYAVISARDCVVLGELAPLYPPLPEPLPWMFKPLLSAATLAVLATTLLAVDKVPEYGITDTYVTGPTMLLRLGVNGEIREVWSGLDSSRMRHVPLFLETSIFCEIKDSGTWRDLRALAYHQAGTRPGYIHLVSDNGLVSVEVTSRRDKGLAPIFVRYSFSDPEDVRLTARFKYPEFTQEAKSTDSNGNVAFSTLWRGENAVLTTAPGPKLNMATDPAGRTVSADKTGFVKEIMQAEEVVLCVDAAESPLAHPEAGSYVRDWASHLGGFVESGAKVAAGRVALESDDKKLDRLFECSLDAVQSHQFASGDVMGDLFFYRDSWLRDGTYTMIGLSLAGDYDAVDRYFAFWDAQRDFSVGGEREAQQPAIGITGMWFYSRLTPKGPAFLRSAWPYVKFYADYYAGRVGREGMLNLAEEWICFIPAPSTWPNAEVYSGLRASAKIAAALGRGEEAGRWNGAADKLQARFSQLAYDAGKGRMIPMAGPAGESFTDPDYPKAESRNGPLRDDRVDSGMLIIPRLEVFGRNQGIIAVDDPRFASTQAEIERDLENPDHSIFRFGPNAASPHAPAGELDTWPINTCWAAQDEWLLGRTDAAWRYVLSGIVNKRLYDLKAGNYYLPENWDRKGVPDKPLIVWSHGDFITSTLLLFLGFNLEPDSGDIGLAPSLPPGMHHARISRFRFRDWHMDFELTRNGNLVDVSLASTDPQDGSGALSIRLPFGKMITRAAGGKAMFTVDPAQYYLAFGRSGNGTERAAIISKVLTGSPPERDPSAMTAAEQEDFIRNTELNYAPANQ